MDVATLVISHSNENEKISPAPQVGQPGEPEKRTSRVSEESLAHDIPPVEEPEYSKLWKLSTRSPMSVAWKELEANLVASRELTKLAREMEEAIMKEWDNFHDYAGARAHPEKWYNLVQGHKEKLAAAADLAL